MARARRLLVGFGACVVVAVALVALVLWRSGVRAESRLTTAQAELRELRTAVAAGDYSLAASRLRRLQADCAAARASTSGPVWAAAASLPYAGGTPRAVRELARAADELARMALPDLVAAARVVAGKDVISRDGRVDLAALSRVGRLLGDAHSAVGPVSGRLRALSDGLVVRRVRHASDQLRTQVNQLETQLGDAARTVDVLPAMLGAGAPRRYFVALQNNAEARGTGGLVGAYAIITADQGRLRLVHTGSDIELLSSLRGPVLPSVDAAFTALYGDDPGLWQNSNMSPHFPYAAALWLQLWHASTGQTLDGAVAVDPIGASYLLAVTGPAHLPDGETIDASNVVASTERDAYRRFATDNTLRKSYLGEVASAVFGSVLGGGLSHAGLASAVRRAVDEQRLVVYSAHPTEEQVLSPWPVSGSLPERAGPFFEVVVNNAGPGKLDYYLRRGVVYSLGACSGGFRPSAVTVTLHSDVPSGRLTPDVVGPSQRLLVYVYLSAGAVPASVSVDGVAARPFIGHERGHPVVELPVDLPPRHSRSLLVRFVEPALSETPVVRTQPLVQPQLTRVEQERC